MIVEETLAGLYVGIVVVDCDLELPVAAGRETIFAGDSENVLMLLEESETLVLSL